MTATLDAPGTTRELVLLGDEDPARRGDRQLVARSECEYRIPDETGLERCLAALRASDAQLAGRADRCYDWQRTWVERTPGGAIKVVFGVSWYDEAFFQAKRDAFLGDLHQRLYAAFGIGQDDIEVTHWRLAA